MFLPVARAADAPRPTIAINRPARSEPVDFYREIVPMLQANCLPCHNRTTTKAELRLETPEDMLKGGESGPALMAGKADESLLLRLSTHAEKPRMPPKDNKVNAVNLTPEELGLLALWIDQGAKASAKRAEVITWQPVASNFQAIFAVALSADGQFAACGRANRLFVYHVPTRTLIAELTDPAVGATNRGAASAHLDLINALAFNPADGTLASGGFREVKLWRPASNPPAATNSPSAWPTNRLRAGDGSRGVSLSTNGLVWLQDRDGKNVTELKSLAGALTNAEAKIAVARQRVEAAKAALETAGKELTAQQERLKKAREAEPAAAKATAEKRAALDKVHREVALLEGRRRQLDVVGFPATNAAALKQLADEKLSGARKAVEGPEAEFAKAERNRSNAENETALARVGLQNATAAQLIAATALREREAVLRLAEIRFSSLQSVANAEPFAAVALESGGRLVATADRAGLLQVWDATTGGELARTTNHFREVSHLDFTDHSTLLAGSETAAAVWRFIPRWRLAEQLGSCGNDSPISDRVNALAFSPDGSRLAGGSGEPTRSSDLHVWDAQSARPVYTLTNLHSDAVLAVAFSPDGRFLASGGADRFARVTETGSGRQVRALEGHTGHVLTVAWKADGEILASGAADNQLKLWKWATGERLKNVEGFGKEVTAAQFLGTTDQLAAASGAAKVRLLNLKGEEVGSLPAGDQFAQALATSADGALAAAGGDDGTLRIWSVKERKLIAEFPAPAPP